MLWLATAIVHHANRVRPNASGVKVGGHQASSASMVSLMTALWFAVLEAPDRVSVKPHASPVLHAINYLLGRLDREYLTTLRQFGGLQSYPSRTKDPDPVDYSTGSVGIGATAPVWGALAHRYVAGHFDVPVGGRQIALIGDAELDEGAIWEAVADPMVAKLGEVMWVVDLNRQSLDRVVPDIAAGRLAGMFEAAGWHVEMVKYGPPRLTAPDGELRARIDAMPNEEYQRLLRAGRRRELRRAARGRRACRATTPTLLAAFRDLGGHDLGALIDAFRKADAERDRPSVVFAYTIKGWRLPTEGHPANHSALLVGRAVRRAGRRSRHRSRRPVGRIRARTRQRPSCAGRRPRGCSASRYARPSRRRCPPRWAASTAAASPPSRRSGASGSTSSARRPTWRRAWSRSRPTSATSTNLGGWINKAGIWSVGERIDWFADDTDTLVRWRESDHGQHIELGIAEVNLVGLLGELGATWSRDGAAAAAGRHDLRPVRGAGARAVVVRDLRRRPVDPRRDAVAASRSGPRAARTSRSSRRRSGSSSRAASRGSRPSGATSSGPSCTRCRGSGGRTAAPAYFRLSTRPIDQVTGAARPRASTCWPAATACAKAPE